MIPNDVRDAIVAMNQAVSYLFSHRADFDPVVMHHIDLADFHLEAAADAIDPDRC